NVRSALDAPGEWFLGRDGRLLYKPLAEQSLDSVSVVAPVADRLIQIEGQPTAGRLVEHLVFRGLSFLHAQWITPDEGFGPVQAAATVDAVIMADGARHVTFDRCSVGHV